MPDLGCVGSLSSPFPGGARTKRKAMIRIGLLVVGLGYLAHGFWLSLKAEVAQVLLDRAWQQTIQGTHQTPPWPWADTWPVARIKVPRLKIDQVVLAMWRLRDIAILISVSSNIFVRERP